MLDEILLCSNIKIRLTREHKQASNEYGYTEATRDEVQAVIALLLLAILFRFNIKILTDLWASDENERTYFIRRCCYENFVLS